MTQKTSHSYPTIHLFAWLLGPQLQRALLWFCLLYIPLAGNAQSQAITRSSVIEVYKGKPYYLHFVHKGETLYSLSQAYGVSIDLLTAENPELAKGLETDMVLRIPQSEASSGATVRPWEEIVVNSGETIYSISRRTGISADSLLVWNPQIANGLQAGMKIRIVAAPKIIQPEPAAPDSVLTPTKGCFDPANLNKTYKVALLLPFALDKVPLVDTAGQPGLTRDADCFDYFQLYAGFLLAADSLAGYGLKLELNTYDAERLKDTLFIQSILRKPELKTMDCIVGPLFAGSFPAVARYARRNAIPVVNPLSKRENLVENNRYVMMVQTPAFALAARLNEYLRNRFQSTHVILVYNGKENSRLVEVTNRLLSSSHLNDQLFTSYQSINFADGGIQAVKSALTPNGSHAVVLLSEDMAMVPGFITLLNANKGTSQISLFGMEAWINAELDSDALTAMDFHCVVSSRIDFESDAVKTFINQFRTRYKATPRQSQHAFLGFDLGWYLFTSLMWYGSDCMQCLPEYKYEGLQYHFEMLRASEANGLQNKSATVLHLVDYKLVEE